MQMKSVFQQQGQAHNPAVPPVQPIALPGSAAPLSPAHSVSVPVSAVTATTYKANNVIVNDVKSVEANPSVTSGYASDSESSGSSEASSSNRNDDGKTIDRRLLMRLGSLIPNSTR